ncbi:hypothetical protein MKO06_01010 [Gramella sp. GC03-9]|uniref:Uncharacterized protein n=1 Tax=Christiangramia oceanisediminis TaxID=2920386 RepID=A0A9X2I9H9_9FLAO|nr:hypothetical protein [Gramella oceanisediminis]MCP9198468.1 hypothetical protein [Gramella oceanisediminis]
MAAYFNTNQLRSSLQELLRMYILECKECNELSQDCIDLIRHNFLAEFVVYNKKDQTIEVGINEEERFDGYPNIKVYTFPLEEIGKKVDYSFKNNSEDLEFYGKMIARKKGLKSSSIIVM